MMIEPHPHLNDQIKRVPKYGKILGVADYGDDFWVGAFSKRPLLPGSRTDKSAQAIGDSSLHSATLKILDTQYFSPIG
jgi:hypothetical protein